MHTVNILEAKTHLSRLVEDIASGNQDVIIIARNGKPVGKLIAFKKPAKRLLGLAAGAYDFDYDAFQALDAKVAQLFEDSADPFGEKLRR